MTKIAIISDTHCGVRNSSDIFIEYQRKFYEEIFFPYLKKHNIKTIIHAGDYYDHRKYIYFKAIKRNREHFLNNLVKDGITMHIIPGNHDVAYKSTNDLCSLKELMGNFRHNVKLYMHPHELKYDTTSISLVPWINNENIEDTIEYLNNINSDIVIGHFELNGFQLMKGITNTNGFTPSELKLNKFDTVLSGHFHTKSTKNNITYLGSQLEFTWADCDDPKFFHVLDTETKDIKAIQNPITIFKKIIYDNTPIDSFDFKSLKDHYVKVVVKNKDDPFLFDRFIDKIYSSGIHDLKIADVINNYNIDDEDASKFVDTSELINYYIDKIEDNMNKNILKGMMKEIYVEAINSEVTV